MYDLVAKFIKKAVPLKGAKLTIIQGLNNRVSSPKAPYVTLKVQDDNQISTPETRYTDKYKIIFSRSEITMKLTFIGNDNIPAAQMAKAFHARFNDSWASEQFEKISDCFFPLYSDDIKIMDDIVNAEKQYDDACYVLCYFEYHAEMGVCEESANEIVMTINHSNHE